MNYDDIFFMKEAVEKALIKLYEKDAYLILSHPQNNKEDSHVSERGIVFRFGIYLQMLLSESQFTDYNIDVEYNRNMYKKKTLPSYANGTFPDLIVHKRGSNQDNILILEFKTWWNRDTREDIKKIKQFMAPDGNYRYKMGASIVLEREKYIINWIDEG